MLPELARRPASLSRLFTVDVTLPCNEVARTVRCLKLKTLMYLSFFSVVPPTSLPILVRDSLCCSLNGVIYTVVLNLSFFAITFME